MSEDQKSAQHALARLITSSLTTSQQLVTRGLQDLGNGMFNPTAPSAQARLLTDLTPLTIRVEVDNGYAVPLIRRNTAIPVKTTFSFHPSEYKYASISIHLLQGEGPTVADNRTLMRASIQGNRVVQPGIPLTTALPEPPAWMMDPEEYVERALRKHRAAARDRRPRTKPNQVEEFDLILEIDVNGILYIQAKNKTTGQQVDVNVTSTSGLSQDAIDQVLNEARAKGWLKS